MNRHTLYLISIVLLVAASLTSAQQPSWERTNGPYGGQIKSLLPMGEAIFAASGSLFRSTNAGVDWHAVGPFRSGTESISVASIARDSADGILALTQQNL